MSKDSRPTSVRHGVVAVTALMAVLLYLDRFCISFAEVFIKEDLRLTDLQIGWMISAFFWTYALGQVPSGWLSDRFGARIMLTTYILTWSLFTALTGWASGFLMLMLIRFGFGLGQAGAYPTGASLISKWVPFSNRGTASSMVAVGGRVGGALAPLLTAYLIVLFVPVQTPSFLDSADVLDARRLSYEILHGEGLAGRAGDRILKLAPHLSAEITPLAEQYRSALQDARGQAKTAGKDPRDAIVRLPPVSSNTAQIVADGLNGVLKRDDFYDAQVFADAAIEREAKRLLARSGQLAPDEVTRLNRLLLEAAFPAAVRKVYGAGWRPVMKAYGIAGLLVAGMFWLVYRDRPSIHPRCNKAEVAVIEQGRPAAAPRPHGAVTKLPILELLTSRSMWLVCISQWCTNVGWVFLVTWLPRYLMSRQVSVEERGLMTFIPAAVGWLGMVFGGKLTDLLVHKIGLRWGRALPMSLSRFTAMAAYLYCVLFDPSPWLAVLAFSVVAFSTDLGTGAVWAFKQDVGGRYVGSILGYGNMWGNLGAAVTPPFLIWIVGPEQANWSAAFLTCAAAFFLAGIANLGVDATIPIAPPDEPAGSGKP